MDKAVRGADRTGERGSSPPASGKVLVSHENSTPSYLDGMTRSHGPVGTTNFTIIWRVFFSSLSLSIVYVNFWQQKTNQKVYMAIIGSRKLRTDGRFVFPGSVRFGFQTYIDNGWLGICLFKKNTSRVRVTDGCRADGHEIHRGTFFDDHQPSEIFNFWSWKKITYATV